jgi:hypothetical protein
MQNNSINTTDEIKLRLDCDFAFALFFMYVYLIHNRDILSKNQCIID